MNKQLDPEQFFKQRGFGKLMGWGKKSALLVVDYTLAFTDPTQPMGAHLDKEIDQTVRVLKAARKAKIPIYYSAIIYEEKDIKDAGLWGKKVAGAIHLQAGSEAVQIDPRLGRQKKEAIIAKKYASAFFGTDLATRLNNQRVDTLMITGCTTSGCVRATAIDAMQNGFRPMVVCEAVGDRDQRAHEQSLFDLHAKYADVVSVEETLKQLEN